MGWWESMWLKESASAHVVGKASVWNKIWMTGKSQPPKASDPASWKERAGKARAQSWHELRAFKETERSTRWELGLKEQIDARGTSSSHPGGSLGLERNLDLISGAREPPSKKCCACLWVTQVWHAVSTFSGALGSLVSLMGKSLAFWVFATQGLV